MFESLFSPIPFLISKWHNLTYTIPTVEKFQDAITFFNYFELSIMPISLIIFIYFIFVLNSISLFHRNISILLHYSLFWIVVGFISRFYILFVRIRIVGIDEDLLFVASFLRLQCYGNILTVQSMVVVERACLLMPIGMFCALYHLRHPAFLRKIRFGNKVRSRSSIRTINETDVYFGNLKKSWL
ncbi:unnamed protein product [Caenorhabditis angaria]|uniref:Uncharacterized protein n=1 Tax=Caenorhabditis angaria TaxID=860376 RepID=A0A9P1IDM6_9PELO|nr:unnamed protein product [Caenorhabditis angaria]